MQELFASPYMRVNHTSDVIGVEICGALKNVLAIAAGIVEGLDLGNNAMAALVTQACQHASKGFMLSVSQTICKHAQLCSPCVRRVAPRYGGLLRRWVPGQLLFLGSLDWGTSC